MTFDAGRLEVLVAARGLALGLPVDFRAVTGSTNDDALAAARAGAPHGSLFVAGSQTAGRGRRGNRWFSQPGQSLTLTLLLRPALAPERAGGIALVAGLAVRAAVESWLGPRSPAKRPLVKWPNDVVIGGRKLCGILAESRVRSTELEAVALGIGLNLGREGMPAALAERAVSLSELGIVAPVGEELVVDLLAEIAPRLSRFSAGEEGIVTEFRACDALVGRRVKVGALEGIAAGINRSGSLLIRGEEDGSVTEVTAGHVETCDDFRERGACSPELDEA